MTIFRFSFVLTLAVLSQPLQSATPGALPQSERAEIVRIVSQVDETAAQAQAKSWVERYRQNMADMGGKLIEAGFKQETEGQPDVGCRSYTYAGKRDGTEKDIIASFVVCPGRLPVALISTLLPIDKNPKGPLPTIAPLKPARGDK